MKDRVRESLFNLLGPEVQGTWALDLFGGTGALALEALSRGAHNALIIERHFPTARIIRENVDGLQIADRVELVTGDTFHWAQRCQTWPTRPWVVFCSPPYRLFVEQFDAMRSLLTTIWNLAPPRSLMAVEAALPFEMASLDFANDWDVRTYPPAVVGILQKVEVIA